MFLTGATGLLGSYLLKILLENANKVYVLGRAKGENGAHKRVLDMLRFWDENIIDKSYLKQLVVIEGDIIYPDFGVKSGYDRERLFSEVEIIFHSAALAELRSPLELIRKINVEGTKNVLEFSSQCRKSGRPIKVNHISTAYVVGNKKGIDFSEDMLELGQGFYNTYEQTKYEAELLVRQYIKNGLDISIFRPSMIMGSTEEGKTNNFRLFYEPLHFFSKKIYNEFPASANCFQNLINIDTVAKALFLLREEKGSNTYHIVDRKSVV